MKAQGRPKMCEYGYGLNKMHFCMAACITSVIILYTGRCDHVANLNAGGVKGVGL